MPSALDEPEL
jgi:hypothetical protein